MYEINAAVAALWRELLEAIARSSEVDLAVTEHPPPRPLHALWTRADLGAAAMCGYPWAAWSAAGVARPVPLAAVVPSPARYCGRPSYCTDIVARVDDGAECIGDLRGRCFGFTAIDSQSGYQAPRRLFAPLALAAGGRFFSKVVGPLVTPRAVVQALLDRTIDAGPLDGYWHDLLVRHEPCTAARLHTIASTAMTPIPLFVASARVPRAAIERLRRAFLAAGEATRLRTLRRELLIERFAPADGKRYAKLAAHAAEIDALGYTAIA